MKTFSGTLVLIALLGIGWGICLYVLHRLSLYRDDATVSIKSTLRDVPPSGESKQILATGATESKTAVIKKPCSCCAKRMEQIREVIRRRQEAREQRAQKSHIEATQENEGL